MIKCRTFRKKRKKTLRKKNHDFFDFLFSFALSIPKLSGSVMNIPFVPRLGGAHRETLLCREVLSGACVRIRTGAGASWHINTPGPHFFSLFLFLLHVVDCEWPTTYSILNRRVDRHIIYIIILCYPWMRDIKEKKQEPEPEPELELRTRIRINLEFKSWRSPRIRLRKTLPYRFNRNT